MGGVIGRLFREFALTLLLGGVPLVLGTGSEVGQPLGYAIVGGLIVSQTLMLFTTPVVYLYLNNSSNALSRWTASKRRDAEPSAKVATIKDAAE